MWRRDWTPIILLILVLAVQTSYALECRGTRCRTEECDENGECICKLPDPSTILDGDRLYLGGKLCDEEQVMCDGTNSFCVSMEGAAMRLSRERTTLATAHLDLLESIVNTVELPAEICFAFTKESA